MKLEYQRLMEIVNKLPEEESWYVLAFLTANDKKCRLRLDELQIAKQAANKEKKNLERDRQRLRETTANQVVLDGLSSKEKDRLVARLNHLENMLEKLVGKPKKVEDENFMQEFRRLVGKVTDLFGAAEEQLHTRPITVLVEENGHTTWQKLS